MNHRGSALLRDTVTMILAGGEGKRLFPLTQYRTKPSVPFGGKYRIIDFALSNCLNSGMRKIYVLTQYKSDSLTRHIFEAWSIFNPALGEFIYTVPPQFKRDNNWYQGTANAIYQNLNLILEDKNQWVLILSGDHIYKMDYLKMLFYHTNLKADLTISCIEYPRSEASRFGVIKSNENNKIIDFIEKPSSPPAIPDNPGFSLVNMGIYIFNAKVLADVLNEMEHKKIENNDFGKHVIPYMIKNGFNIYSYKFVDENQKDSPYWVDVGTIESYYDANMDLISVSPVFNLYDSHWPLRTMQYQFPPAKTLSHGAERVGRAFNSLITDGTIISGGYVDSSILGPNVKINSYSYIKDSIIMNNVQIGRYSHIRKTIIDKNVIVPPHTEIGFDIDKDKKRFKVSEEGIVIIPKNYIFE